MSSARTVFNCYFCLGCIRYEDQVPIECGIREGTRYASSSHRSGETELAGIRGNYLKCVPYSRGTRRMNIALRTYGVP